MPANNVQTLILRFRDLATAPGGTIRTHREEIVEHNYVWWGWWNKAAEKVPTETFTQLNKQAKGPGLDLFLFDSGRDYVYRAKCIEIHWENDLTRCQSPDGNATPKYYGKEPYFAWFKFRTISEDLLDASELKKWTYVEVDEFFQEGFSRYKPFDGKQVYSPEELRQQDRTIWFVRGFQAGDSSHEISLLDAQTFVPSDFPGDCTISRFEHLLWLSDLHFCKDGHHRFPLSSSATERALWHSIEDVLKQEKLDRLVGTVITGDLTWRATGSEFGLARDFIGELSRKLNLKSYDFLLCPGNHDMAFAKEPWDDSQKVTATSQEASAEFAKFYEDLFYIHPNEFLAAGRRMIFRQAVPVEIVALNTSLLPQKENMFQGHGFVGQDQLDFVARQMGWGARSNEEGSLRILMLHHHVLPVTYREIPKAGEHYSVALDAEAIVRWVIKNRVKIVLHGHKHQPFHAKVTRKIQPDDSQGEHEFWVVGLGSSGAAKAHLGEIGKNTIGVLTFSRQAVKLGVYTIDPVNPPTEAWTLSIPI